MATNEPNRNVYVGHRYVPLILGEWLQTETYEGLSIVTHMGDSYTSKKRVPIGIPISNEEYWVITGNYNAQIDQYRQDVNTFKEEINAKLVDIVTVKPSGNASTDTTNIQNAFNTSRNVKFQNKKDNPFLINAPIFIRPIDESPTNVSSNGRVIDVQNATIKATNNIANVFVYDGTVFPGSIKNVTFENVLFDGEVTDSFMLINNSFASFCNFENVFTTYDAKGNSVIRFLNTDVTGQLQGGIHNIKHVRGMNQIKNTLRFSKNVGANSLFDDLIIEDISSRYIGQSSVTDHQGRCMLVDDGCIITISSIKRLFAGGYGSVIGLGAGSSLMDCAIEQLYYEPLGANAYGIIGGSLSGCTINIIRGYLGMGQTVTNFARCIYSQPVNCTISHLGQDVAGALPATGVYYEEIGIVSKGNTLSYIGDDPITRIKLATSNGNTQIKGYYGDPYLYAKGGNLVSESSNTAKTINLLNLPKSDLDSCNTIRVKIKGECSSNVLNVFKLQLTGASATVDLLNCNAAISASVSTFELETDIYIPNTTNIYSISKSILGNTVVNTVGSGTPLRSPLTYSTDLKIVMNVTSSSFINVLSITAEKINNTLKPLTGGLYAQ